MCYLELSPKGKMPIPHEAEDLFAYKTRTFVTKQTP